MIGATKGFDYVSAPSATARLAGSVLTFENQVGLREDLQYWLEGGSNFGWILIASDESRRNTLRRFGSREDPVLAPRLTVFYAVPPPQPPVIVVGLRDTAAPTGGNATFSVVATGTAPLSYQWFRNGLAIELARSELLILQNLTKDRSGSYAVRVSNGGGSATSEPASLVVLDPPVIVAHPMNQFVKPGERVELTVWANGDELAYQWIHSGQPVIGATESTLIVESFQGGDAGAYVARVVNAAATAQTDPAVLTLVRAPVIERIRHEGGEVRFEFDVQAGVPCLVEYADQLPAATWQRLIRVSSPLTPMQFPVHDQPAGRQRFYRVVVE